MSSPKLIQFKQTGNTSLGFLVPVEELKDIPFETKRVFWTTGIPDGTTRGHHAHHETHQVLVCVQGRIVVETTERNGEKQQFELTAPNQGLHLPPDAWHTMTYYDNAIQVVLASGLYDEKDYIRDFNTFINP